MEPISPRRRTPKKKKGSERKREADSFVQGVDPVMTPLPPQSHPPRAVRHRSTVNGSKSLAANAFCPLNEAYSFKVERDNTKQNPRSNRTLFLFRKLCHTIATTTEAALNMLCTACRGFFGSGQRGASLHVDEIRLLFKNLGEEITDDEIDEILKDAKVDAAGRVYYTDFVELMESK
ncbi:hypothetical protein DFJ73DRAFT_344264 [Zopfochytrium polystomum]|nr:hypothetical protein DFJ73DRAFT_344264 [Zopfochytrium polystomum]